MIAIFLAFATFFAPMAYTSKVSVQGLDRYATVKFPAELKGFRQGSGSAGHRPLNNYDDIVALVEENHRLDRLFSDSLGFESAEMEVYAPSLEASREALNRLHRLIEELGLEHQTDQRATMRRGNVQGVRIRIPGVRNLLDYARIRDSVLNFRAAGMSVTLKEKAYIPRTDLDTTRRFMALVESLPAADRAFARNYLFRLFRYHSETVNSLKEFATVYISVGDETAFEETERQVPDPSLPAKGGRLRTMSVLEVTIVVAVALGVSVVFLLVTILVLVLRRGDRDGAAKAP